MVLKQSSMYDPDAAKAINKRGREIMKRSIIEAAMITYDITEEVADIYKDIYGSYPAVFKKWDYVVADLKVIERNLKIKKILGRL